MAEQTNEVMATIAIGYKTYVMPVEAAITIAKVMVQAERYFRSYRPASEGGSTYHVFPDEDVEGVEVNVIPRSRYLAGKLAGKPE